MNRAVYVLRRVLQERGLSQNQAAALVGADSGNFSKIMRGGRHGPGRVVAFAIQQEFGIEIPWWDEEVDEHGNPVAHESCEYGAVDPEPTTGTESEG
jgi:transcriptional regulator with XRE-family HTH domain